ncbi:unnamed protein product [Gongylonema pulchrum]|uniref:AAA_11 domain-containing protein n=1 Tax=Gongylonema pulchrum TaxID=637853 RepID=A0A183DJ57_9BILA|nr:unnamed protein product [Gongylonema pulchrum]
MMNNLFHRSELEPQHGIEPSQRDASIVVEPHVLPCRGPYPHVEPRKNTIHFTPAQIEAIKSGMQPGLTMVVGPPGTGKTDVAVQIISNIYHNWPEQRTLIVEKLQEALEVTGDVSYTCETAGHFFLYQVRCIDS